MLNISVIPQTSYRLAPAIWKKMYDYPLNYYSHAPARPATRWSPLLHQLLVQLSSYHLQLFSPQTQLLSQCDSSTTAYNSVDSITMMTSPSTLTAQTPPLPTRAPPPAEDRTKFVSDGIVELLGILVLGYLLR